VDEALRWSDIRFAWPDLEREDRLTILSCRSEALIDKVAGSLQHPQTFPKYVNRGGHEEQISCRLTKVYKNPAPLVSSPDYRPSLPTIEVQSYALSEIDIERH
jgi:hypothetical protein